ncbi:ribbon-helix-helix domain-containing protein [Sneathiella aquimaris]|uniref:ribbon-helix-helix domain-containing protein n=1 Tax=Sneathiella aquimaris TaxID=2599305 RepID=UPI00146D40FA|nr:ribbon-helix-helix domain-containing protein [Sneathiella aquimaris]
MAKRPKLSSSHLAGNSKLSGFTSQKPSTEKAEVVPESKANKVPQGDNRAGTRENTKGQTLRLNEDAWAQLKYMAIDQRRPAHALLVEAVNELFKKYGKAPIA